MRTMDTSKIIDKNRQMIGELYEVRLGKCPSELDLPDLAKPVVLRALAELRLYHLPPYKKIQHRIKARIQANGALLNGLSDAPRVNFLERELCNSGSLVFASSVAQARCPECRGQRDPFAGLCGQCWSELFEQEWRKWRASLDPDWARPSPARFRMFYDDLPQSLAPIAPLLDDMLGDPVIGTVTQVRKELMNRVRTAAAPKHTDEVSWCSPKKAFMAIEYGCVVCGTRIEYDGFLWGDDRANEWEEGACPDCQDSLADPDAQWSLQPAVEGARYWAATASQVRHAECRMCNSSDFEYAFWGMCEICYGSWQQVYAGLEELKRISKDYGQCALLLVWPSLTWLEYLRPILHRTMPRALPGGDLEELRLRDRTRREFKGGPPKTMEAAGVSIADILWKRRNDK